MHRDTRKLLRHSGMTACLLIRWAFRDPRFNYTMAVLLFLVALCTRAGIFAALVSPACWMLLAYIIDFMERRVLTPLRQGEAVEVSVWEWALIASVLGGLVSIQWWFLP